MLILLLSLLFGWFLTSLTINLVNLIFIKFLNLTSLKSKVISIIIGGLLGFIILSMIPYELINESMNVYCTNNSEELSNPYIVTVGSEYYNSKFSFDIRNLRDLGALGVIGKTSVSVAKSVPASAKVAAIGTASAIGTAYLGVRVLEFMENQKRVFTITKNNESVNLTIEPNPEMGGTEKDVEEVAKNIKINSPFEASEILEGIKMILFCTEILSTLAIISFIICSLLIYIKFVSSSKLNYIKNPFVIKLVSLAQKAGNIYIYVWGSLTLFNVSTILYLTTRLSRFLDTLT